MVRQPVPAHHRFKLLRKKKKVSQKELAQAMGLSQGAVSKIENGKLRLRADQLPIIADKFNMKVDELTKYFYAS